MWVLIKFWEFWFFGGRFEILGLLVEFLKIEGFLHMLFFMFLLDIMCCLLGYDGTLAELEKQKFMLWRDKHAKRDG